MLVHPVYSTQEVLELTYKLTKDVMNIDGDLIECGVAAGSQIGAMQQCILDNNISKNIYGYDSFEGIPFGTDDDDLQPALGAINQEMKGKLISTGVSSNSQSDVLGNFERWKLPVNNLHLIKGWFQDTMPLSNHDKIALLRLDGDLYESTKVCMQYLFPKLQSKGVLIIDDWALSGCRKAILETLDLKDIIEIYGISYYIKP